MAALLSGCSRSSEDDLAFDGTSAEHEVVQPPEPETEIGLGQPFEQGDSDSGQELTGTNRAAPSSERAEQAERAEEDSGREKPSGSSAEPAGSAVDPSPPAEGETLPTPFSIASAEESQVNISRSPTRELRSDLSPAELLEFLHFADQDMQLIATGRAGLTDEKEASEEMRRIVRRKLEAARRLMEHPEASERQQVEGKRGELQALSHLASLGELKAAEELERLVRGYVQAGDPDLTGDSQLVLIGFAIEALQNGEPDAAGRLLQLIESLASEVSSENLPAMTVMGQARVALASYGNDSEASRVRELILAKFADSPNQLIARMAAQLAGSVSYDKVEELRSQVETGKKVSPDQWRESAQTLIDESADIQTVRYLAGTALFFESVGRRELADVTYELLQQNFTDASTAMGREAEIALEAHKARESVLGRTFDPDLPAVGGDELKMDRFAGKVVLMPFWDSRFPQSLQLLPKLKEIRAAHPDSVAIVGMNLDLEGAPVEAFMEQNNLDFPSYRSESSPTAMIANEVAARFGLVSMPFVAILDRKGRVVALNFSGARLEQTVEELLAE